MNENWVSLFSFFRTDSLESVSSPGTVSKASSAEALKGIPLRATRKPAGAGRLLWAAPFPCASTPFWKGGMIIQGGGAEVGILLNH